MATSPNYGWLEPDNTDLVKNGALAIRTLGNAIDTTMATMTPKSIVDAKGDLIAASAADTPARLAVGNNGETLVADSSTATGLRYQEPKATNPILNSAYQVWQRGTSVAFGAFGSPYGPDRWNVFSGNTGTCSRQATGDTTNLPNIQYAARVQRTAAVTSTDAFEFGQAFETINSIPFVGKTVTLSFYIRKGADFSGSTLNAQLISGTGTDQNPISGSYTGQATPISTNISSSLTTTWQRISLTGTVATSATELTVRFYWVPSGTAGAADYYEVTGVQLEVGSVATPFKTYAGTIQGELAACQRYYSKSYAQATAPATNSSNNYQFAGAPNSATNVTLVGVTYPVVMRTAPTVTVYSYTSSTTAKVSDAGGTDLAANSGSTAAVNDRAFVVYNGSGGTINQSNGGFIFHWVASAEL